MEKPFKKRVLFVGTPDFALIALNKFISVGVNIIGVVGPHKTHSTYILMKNFCDIYNLKYIDYENSLNDVDFINKLENLNLDIAVVCSYGKRFGEKFLKTTKDGFINCHPSLLPNYRGGNPYSHVIINNEKITGITLHYMDLNFDTGDIICQYKSPIDKNETMGTLFNKLSHLGTNILISALTQYEQKGKLSAEKQPKGIFKEAKNIDPLKGDNIIIWNNNADYLERFIRALNPFISAITTFRGVLFKIHNSFIKNKNYSQIPGTICEIGKDYIGVSTLRGTLCIKTLQFGSYFIGDANDFINRYKPKKGEKFGQ